MEDTLVDAGDGMSRGVLYSYAVTSSGPNKGTYQWWLGDFFGSQAPYLETEDFVLGCRKWKLRLFPKVTHFGVDYISINLVSLNQEQVAAELVVTAINRSNPQNSANSGGRFTFHDNQEHGFSCFQERSTVMDPAAGFFCSGRYVLEVTIAVVQGAASNEAASSAAPFSAEVDNRMIEVTVVDDGDIFGMNPPMHPFGLPFSMDGLQCFVPATSDMSALINLVCTEKNTTSANVRMWLCGHKSDGSLSVQLPISNDLLSSAITVGSFCGAGNGVTDGQLTFYLEQLVDDSAPVTEDTWMLFFKIYDIESKELTYLGGFTRDKADPLSLLIEDVTTLHELHLGRTLHVVDGLFTQELELSPRALDTTKDLTLEAGGLFDKAVIIACYNEGEPVPVERMQIWLVEAFQKDMQRLLDANQHDTSSNEDLSTTGQPSGQLDLLDLAVEDCDAKLSLTTMDDEPDEELCAICWDRPRTSGFLHADQGAHLCACQECAESIMKMDNPRCPLCNQEVVHIIKRYH